METFYAIKEFVKSIFRIKLKDREHYTAEDCFANIISIISTVYVINSR